MNFAEPEGTVADPGKWKHHVNLAALITERVAAFHPEGVTINFMNHANASSRVTTRAQVEALYSFDPQGRTPLAAAGQSLVWRRQ